MPVTYSADALSYDSDEEAWTLRSDFDPSQHLVNIAVSDDDSLLDGDAGTGNNEVGADGNQTAVITDMLGNPVASGQIYAENSYEVEGGGSSITIQVLEIGGTVVGYVVSEPLTPGAELESDSTSDVTAGNAQTLASFHDFACFGPGTLIATLDGALPVEWIAPGDMVITRDHGAQPLRWIGHRRFTAVEVMRTPALWPVQIHPEAPDALDDPPLMLSKQHRVLIANPDAEYLFGQAEVLAAAKHLAPQVLPHTPNGTFCYFHMIFDAHEIVLANGIWVESLLSQEAAAQSYTPPLPPGLTHSHTARRCLTRWEAALCRRDQPLRPARHRRPAA